MIVLIDMDEVLSDFEGRLREIWSNKYPHTPIFTNETREQFYIGSSTRDGNQDQINKIIHNKGFFGSLNMIPGSKEAVDEMITLGHDVFILTSPGISNPYAATEKYKWISKHYGSYMLERLIITPAKPLIRGDILIDDKPRIANEEQAVWEHVLYDKSYNKTVQGKRRITWEDWKEVLTELL